MMTNEAFQYSDPASGATPITLTAAASTAGIYVLTGTEKSYQDILDRINALSNIDVIGFPENAEDRPHRLIGTLDGASGTTDAQTGGEDVLGAMFTTLEGTLAVQLVKLFTHTATFSATQLGGGRQSGAQTLQKAASVASTGAMEAITNNGVTPQVWTDGVVAGWSISDIGPFRAVVRKPFKTTAAGVTGRHMRWA